MESRALSAALGEESGMVPPLGRDAEVGFDNGGIELNLLGRAFGKFLAVVENEDTVADGGNGLYVVLDVHDGSAAGADFAQQVQHAIGLGAGEAATDFVAEEDFGAGGQGARHFKFLLVA